MMITGVTEQTSPTKPSFAVLHSPDYEPISEAAKWAATPSEWPKSCFYSGGNQLDDVGGKESS